MSNTGQLICTGVLIVVRENDSSVDAPRQLTYLLSSLETGGAQWGMIRLLRNLSPRDFDVTVVALKAEDDRLIAELPAHVAFVNLNISPRYRIDRLWPLLSILRETDILVCSLYHATIIGRILGTLYSVPTVVNWKHNGRFRGTGRRFLYFLTNNLSDGVFADSTYVAKAMRTQSASPPIHVVPIAGVDVDRFEQVGHGGTDELIVGSLGTLRWEKQHEQVLAVAEELPSITFLIGGDGPRFGLLEDEIVSRSLKNVKLVGHVDDVPGFLAGLDIYFQPSLSEGLCITVIEAMAAGLPIVASDVGGISNSVVHGETGYLRPPTDTTGFARDIQKLSENPNLRTRFGRKSRSRVGEEFSDEVLLKSFIKGLNQACRD